MYPNDGDIVRRKEEYTPPGEPAIPKHIINHRESSHHPAEIIITLKVIIIH
jgi:hypothetical protein